MRFRHIEPQRQHLRTQRRDFGGGSIERVLLNIGHDHIHAALGGDA